MRTNIHNIGTSLLPGFVYVYNFSYLLQFKKIRTVLLATSTVVLKSLL